MFGKLDIKQIICRFNWNSNSGKQTVLCTINQRTVTTLYMFMFQILIIEELMNLYPSKQFNSAASKLKLRRGN